MKNKQNGARKISKSATVVGAVCFFALVAGIVTIALLIYGAVSAENSDRTLISVIMLFVVLVMAAFCTVFDYVRRRITVDRPVRQILDATDDIAQGDFSVRLNTRHALARYDEYDCIMENINKMSAELGKSEILKNDFISNVSHELKTPLAIIQNYAALLKQEDLPSDVRAEYADTLSQAAARLTDLITNILKLNKLENQQITPERETVRLDEMLSQATLNFVDAIDAKGIELDCDFDELTVTACASYLEIVWNNLLSNAVKFTEKGGKISLSLKNEQNCAVVRVSDTGCGISPEAGKRIFDKFYQGDTSHSKEGNGLGLALVKKVIDLSGGEITVESELDKGTTFTVKLKGVEIEKEQ